MDRINKVMAVAYKKLHFEKWDNCLLVTGDEGTGKTNLVLNLLDGWYTSKYGECKPEFINRLGMSPEGFAYALKVANKGDAVDYDESGELSNKRQLNKFNILITSSYMVIRNENLQTFLTIPDVFELNPFFTKRRARGLICVYARGKLAYWNKPRLRLIVDLNANKIRKTVWRVPPLFFDTFPIYDGPLLPAYEQMKDEHTKRTKEEIYTKLTESNKPDKLTEVLMKAKEIIGTTKTAEIFGIDPDTVRNRIKRQKAETAALIYNT